MKAEIQNVILFIFLASAIPIIASDAPAWELAHKTDDGIVIYARPLSNSGIRELKANIIIDAAPADVWLAVMDRNTYQRSRKHVEIDRIFKTDNENIWYNYQRYSLPVVSKRDYTLRYESFQDPINMAYRIEWRTANEKGPVEEKGVIRLIVCYGSFTIEPLDKGQRTLITYIACIDPAGIIPAWLANAVAKGSVPGLLRDVRDQSIKYKNKLIKK